MEVRFGPRAEVWFDPDYLAMSGLVLEGMEVINRLVSGELYPHDHQVLFMRGLRRSCRSCSSLSPLDF